VSSEAGEVHWRVTVPQFASSIDRSVAAAPRRAKHQKPAACFARRVKRAAQKYISFRNTVFMI
jgi:hypothetical protein